MQTEKRAIFGGFQTLAVALALIMASGCVTRVVYAPAAEAISQPLPTGWAERVLPGVVLFLSTRADGRIVYGAGLLVEGQRHVLTSLHVVEGSKSLGAMFYDARRTSYTAFDGGLTRYLRENSAAIVPAHLVRADPDDDLALVEIDAGTSALPHLPVRRTPVVVGERVAAIGHPGESVWSVTLGIVSSIHRGAIQHDAGLTEGNWGGPLVDAEGRVVGINTSKLTHGAERIGFARPIVLARSFETGLASW